MSADNCVAIASFPSNDGEKEWRVAEIMGPDNLDDQCRNIPGNVCDAIRFQYFNRSKVFNSDKEASEEAMRMYNMGDFFEYGILQFDFDRPFKQMTPEESVKIVEEYFKFKG